MNRWWCYWWQMVVVALVFMVFLPTPTISHPQTRILYTGCSLINATNVQNFFTNLNDTYSEVRRQLSTNNTYFATADQTRNSEPVYVMAQCRKYMSTRDCLACFDYSVRSIRPCGLGNGARVILDGCFISMMNFNRNRNNRRTEQRRLTAMVTRQMTQAIPQVVQQLQAVQPPPNAPAPTITAHIRNFTACSPPKFAGNDGATALLQWFEKVESVFAIAQIPADLHVMYAASTFSSRALTWWNKEKQTRGMDVAHNMPWATFREIMTEEFCPESELKRLDEEFWALKQDSGNNVEYTTRFHELSLLVPHFVTPLRKAIDRYISGLPTAVRDVVRGSRPPSVEIAVRLAATITDDLVRDGILKRTNKKKSNDKGKRKVEEGSTSESPKTEKSKKKKRGDKSKSYAAVEPVRQPAYVAVEPTRQTVNPAPRQQPAHIPVTTNRKPYTGPAPTCPRCTFHHELHKPCRLCTNCNTLGHFANACKVGQNVAVPMTINTFAPPPPPNQGHMPRYGCYGCGDPTHFIRDCPHRHTNPPPVQQHQAQPHVAIQNQQQVQQAQQPAGRGRPMQSILNKLRQTTKS